MVIDHGTMASEGITVEEMAISKFKASCLAVLERVRRTKKPIRVTRFGTPVAEIVPPSEPEQAQRSLGAMAGTIEILGDIVSPAGDESDWEASRE
jgi:prevent-host-death family protein